MERRTFVSVTPAAKKNKLGPIFSKNIRVIYKLSVKKQETGQKTAKNPPKKAFLSALALEFRRWGAPFAEFRRWGASFTEFRKWGAPFAEFRRWGTSFAEFRKWGAPFAE